MSLFGNRARTDLGMPPKFMFCPPAEGRRWQVVVIAQLESANGEVEAAPIVSIAFRRDPVTPQTAQVRRCQPPV